MSLIMARRLTLNVQPMVLSEEPRRKLGDHSISRAPLASISMLMGKLGEWCRRILQTRSKNVNQMPKQTL